MSNGTTATLLPPPATRAAPTKPRFNISSGVRKAAQAVVIFGTGGIGKSTLAAGAPDPVFIDIEHGTNDLDVKRIGEGQILNWLDLREAVRSDVCKSSGTVVIDTGSAAEELCRKHVIANVPGGKNQIIKSIEDYGFGKGGTFLVEEWRNLLSDLDAHRREGRNVVLICHERVGKVPNPSGDDFIRYEPRLFSDRNASIMHVTKEWADHVLFVSYDVASKDGKAKGSGTRTIYTTEMATFMAKTRNLPPSPIIFERGNTDLWKLMLNPIAQPVEAAPEI
jgi:hypothetical protein